MTKYETYYIMDMEIKQWHNSSNLLQLIIFIILFLLIYFKVQTIIGSVNYGTIPKLF